MVCESTKFPIWNQYFNFEIKSISTDILEISFMNLNGGIISNKCFGKVELPIYELLDGKIKKDKYNFGSQAFLSMKPQIVFPNNIPFTDYKIDYDNIFIKFLDGENLSFGDIYCQCKLTNDIS